MRSTEKGVPVAGSRVQLLAMRHGAAGRATTDLDRALTDEGREQVRQVAKQLASELPARPEKLFSSPYPRARETASIAGALLGAAVETLSELGAGEATSSDIVIALRALAPSATRLMIVGHAPDLGDLVSALTGSSRATLATAEVAQLEGERLERGAMRLVQIWSPDEQRRQPEWI